MIDGVSNSWSQGHTNESYLGRPRERKWLSVFPGNSDTEKPSSWSTPELGWPALNKDLKRDTPSCEAGEKQTDREVAVEETGARKLRKWVLIETAEVGLGPSRGVDAGSKTSRWAPREPRRGHEGCSEPDKVALAP